MRYVLTKVLVATLVFGSARAAEEGDGPPPGPPPHERGNGPPPSHPHPPPHPPPHHGEGRPWRGLPRPGPFGEATDEQVEEIRAFVSEHLPTFGAKLDEMRAESPERFRGLMRRLRFEVHQLLQLRERDPEAFAKAIEGRRLGLQVREIATRLEENTDEEQRERLRGRLRELVAQLFDAELVAQRAHVRRLEEKLQKLRETLKKRAAHREEIVRERVERILEGDTPEGPDWNRRRGRRGRPERDKNEKETPAETRED